MIDEGYVKLNEFFWEFMVSIEILITEIIQGS